MLHIFFYDCHCLDLLFLLHSRKNELSGVKVRINEAYKPTLQVIPVFAKSTCFLAYYILCIQFTNFGSVFCYVSFCKNSLNLRITPL